MEGEIQLKLCLVLESRLRGLLQREKRDMKKGKNRKLNKADLAAVEDELRLFAFKPDQFVRDQIARPTSFPAEPPAESPAAAAAAAQAPAPGSNPDDKGKEEVSLSASAANL